MVNLIAGLREFCPQFDFSMLLSLSPEKRQKFSIDLYIRISILSGYCFNRFAAESCVKLITSQDFNIIDFKKSMIREARFQDDIYEFLEETLEESDAAVRCYELSRFLEASVDLFDNLQSDAYLSMIYGLLSSVPPRIDVHSLLIGALNGNTDMIPLQ